MRSEINIIGSVLIVLLSGQAQATPATAQAAIAADRTLTITGTSAVKELLKSVLSKPALACQSNTMEVYATANPNVNAYACTIANGSRVAEANPGWNGQFVVFFHSVDGGSISAVSGLSATVDYQANFPDISASNCTGTGLVYACGSKYIKRRSDGGFSESGTDLNENIIQSMPNLNLSSWKNDFNSTPVAAGQGFGLAASLPLYRALQAQQGLPANCQDGGDDDASSVCEPTISQMDYASLVAQQNAGYITNWGSVGLSQPEAAVICRQTPASGTQVISNAYFLREGCGAGAVSPSAAVDSTINAYEVVENNTEPTAESCLNQGNTASVGHRFRMGVLSTRRKPVASDSWRFVKLDGLAVNEDDEQRKSIISGRYRFAQQFFVVFGSFASAGKGQALSALADGLGRADLLTYERGIFATASSDLQNPSAYPNIMHKGLQVGGSSCTPFLYVY